MAQSLPQHTEAEEGDKEELEVAIKKAPKAFNGEEPLSNNQLNLINMLIFSKKVYMNANESIQKQILFGSGREFHVMVPLP
ncbi:uncharacterized protein PGTG_21343 [Puccinia graminis f. sp. tritici CRL 75-36-700-3]|uniref:Uncharacterized protein n=1 Tax=Puccinia graminis f. sp. tritici (strain CRL 75-36-700-3 / race SCCL) TaxID=418459 RepID=H6QR00_PUCGT|nr:uncharacterized protein PGTG_21343 [Puccinia graminis f. sp. tritici CRL 75-36-700-3]EHS62976.1 hypothetical protein PGTG_21343 [Puccinia graminis f. sp. tritici CRL 75-36-700-3]